MGAQAARCCKHNGHTVVDRIIPALMGTFAGMKNDMRHIIGTFSPIVGCMIASLTAGGGGETGKATNFNHTYTRALRQQHA